MPIIFKCNQCPATFHSFEELVEHFEAEHNSKDLRTVKQWDDRKAMLESSRIKG